MEDVSNGNRVIAQKKSSRTLRILLGIYAILYLVFAIDYFLPINALNSWDIEYSVLIMLFGIFIAGYLISWKSELVSGMIFILWFIIMCYENFFLCTSDCGAGIAMGIPLLIISILLIIHSRR